MSKNRYKVEYKCDCGMDWGSCGRRNLFLLEDNCSCDIITIVQYNHMDDPDSKPQYLGAFTMDEEKALIKILNRESTSTWTEEDHSILKQARQW